MKRLTLHLKHRRKPMCDEDWCAEIEAWLNEQYIPWFNAHSGGIQPLSGGTTSPPKPPKKPGSGD